MDLDPYVTSLRRDLAAAAGAGSDDTRRVADLLAVALDPAARLCLVDAVSQVADEITAALAGSASASTVEVRMRGREPQIVVTATPVLPDRAPPTAPTPPAPPAPTAVEAPADPDESGTARVTVRLPEALKIRCDGAATAAGISLNGWIIRTLTDTITSHPARDDTPYDDGRSRRRAARRGPGTHITGYGRG